MLLPVANRKPRNSFQFVTIAQVAAQVTLLKSHIIRINRTSTTANDRPFCIRIQIVRHEAIRHLNITIQEQ